MSPWNPFFSRLKIPILSAFSHRRGFPASHNFCGTPLDQLQQVHVSPVLRTPELGEVLQEGFHHIRAEWQNYSLQSAENHYTWRISPTFLFPIGL